MTMPEVEVNIENPPEEPEAPPVVIVEDSAPEIPTEIPEHGHAEHESRHAEHEARHDREGNIITESLDRIEGSLEEITNRLSSLEQRHGTTESQVAELEETLENGNSETEEPEAISITEPEPDIENIDNPHWLRKAGW